MSTLDFSEPQHLFHRFDEKPLTTTALRFMKHGGIELSGAEYGEAGVAALRDALTARLERVAAKRAAHDALEKKVGEWLVIDDPYRGGERMEVAPAMGCGLAPAKMGGVVRFIAKHPYTQQPISVRDVNINDVPTLIAKLQAIHEFYAPKEAQ